VVLEVTARTLDGKVVDTQSRHYHSQSTNQKDSRMIYGGQWKVANERDTSLQPYQTKAETFEFNLPDGVAEVEVTVNLFWEHVNPEMRYEIHQITETVTLNR
jgi:hypothetical protein